MHKKYKHNVHIDQLAHKLEEVENFVSLCRKFNKSSTIKNMAEEYKKEMSEYLDALYNRDILLLFFVFEEKYNINKENLEGDEAEKIFKSYYYNWYDRLKSMEEQYYSSMNYAVDGRALHIHDVLEECIVQDIRNFLKSVIHNITDLATTDLILDIISLKEPDIEYHI